MLGEIIHTAGDVIGNALTSLFAGEKDHTYQADFGRESDFFSRFNKGFAVGSKSITRFLSHENCLLVGSTGTGKTQKIILHTIASLAKGKSSMVINDAEGECLKYTFPILEKHYKIHVINHSRAACSQSFNPLALCSSVAEIQKLAQIIVINALGKPQGDIFWHQSSIMLIALFGRYLVFHAEPKYRTLQNILRMIDRFAYRPESIDKLFAAVRNDDSILEAYKSVAAISDRTIQSVIASTRTALNLFYDNEVCQSTCTNSIDFESIRSVPTAIFLSNPLPDQEYYKPLTTTFIQSLLSYELRKPVDRGARSLFFIIEEMGSMFFPNIGSTTATVRKHNIGLMCCLQEEKSLAAYGENVAAEVITNCRLKIYMEGQNIFTAQRLSQLLGTYTYTDDKNIQRTRPLLTSDELHRLKDTLVFVGNAPGFLCSPRSFYECHPSPSKEFTPPSNNMVNPSLIPFDEPQISI